MIKRFIRYYKPHRKLFALDMLCSFLLSICDLFYPMITRSMLNDYIPNKKLRVLILWGIILLVIYLIKWASSILSNISDMSSACACRRI